MTVSTARRMYIESFPFQQDALAFDAPMIAGQATVAMHNAVARNGNSQQVGCAGTGNGTGGTGCANAPGDFRIAGSFPRRNFAQRLPDTLLERCSMNVERVFKARFRMFCELSYSVQQLRETGIVGSSRRNFRLRKAFVECLNQVLRIIAQEDGTDTTHADSNEH